MVKSRKLFFNGLIHTLDASHPRANSILIEDGIITALGNDISPGGIVERIDLEHFVVVPGLTDAHVHLQGFGRYLEELQLNQVTSAKFAAETVHKKAVRTPAGTWILGRGWDQTKWPGKDFPVDAILNHAAPDHPVMLTRVDGHAIWVNQRARQLAGYTPGMPLPEGSSVKNDCIFLDNAIPLFHKALPGVTEETLERQIRLGAKTFVSRGLTSVHDVWQDERIILIIRRLIAMGEFPLRCYGMLEYNNEPLLEEFFRTGPYESDRYTIRGVKAFMDGALGSRGAALLDPYADDPGNRGLRLMERDEFHKLAIRCRDAGFQLNTHAIGDRAVRSVLDTYGDVLAGVRDHRWRIEHAQMVADADLPRFRALGIIPSLQPTHCTSDMRWLADRLGQARTRLISRTKSFISQGIRVPAGSDCPIETGDPRYEIYAAVTRQDHAGNPRGGWHPEERVAPLEALRMLTTWPAYAGFAEHRRGPLKPGYDADFTVLDQDITKLADRRILDTKVRMTVVAGQIVFRG